MSKPTTKRVAAKALRTICGTFATWLAAASWAVAAVPGEVNYQGLLLDDLGAPIDGAVSMDFALFDQDSGGTQLWTESHPVVTVVEGVYEVALGSITPLGGSLLAGGALYLEITVDGDTLSPRQRLLAVPYALRAEVAESVTAIDGVPDEYVSQLFLHTNFDGGPPNDDPQEGFADTDGDSILNLVDPDNDNDGLSDEQEVLAGSDINLVTPVISGFSPSTANAVKTSTITLLGTSFDPAMTVAFGTENPTPVGVSPTSAQVDVGPQPEGSASVVVTLPNGQQGSSAFDFVCLPEITSVSVGEAKVGVPTLVSVTGSNLETGYSVTLGGVGLTPSNQTLTGFDVTVDLATAGAKTLQIDYPNGCSDTLANAIEMLPLYVFVTSSVHSGDLGGIAAADAICQARASSAGLANPPGFLAWLSDGSDSPDARFSKPAVSHGLVDGTLVANDWADLTDGVLAVPIDRTESGSTIGSGSTWTNTASDGTNAGAGDCSGWTTTTGGGGHGTIGAVDATWTATGTLSCTNPFRLICVEQ